MFSNLPTNIKKKSFRNLLIPVKPLRIDVSHEESSPSSAIVKVAKKSDVKVLQKLDGRFFGGQKISVNIKNDDEQYKSLSSKLKELPPELKDVKQQTKLIEDTGRLFVRNVPYVCTPLDLEVAFKAFGPLADIKMPVDFETKQHKGYAMVSFVLPEDALKAFNEMDGTVFHGRMLHLVAGYYILRFNL